MKSGQILAEYCLNVVDDDYIVQTGMSGNSRSRLFPGTRASDSRSQILGMDFFIPFPFPNFGNGIVSFHSHFRIWHFIVGIGVGNLKRNGGLLPVSI